MKISSAWPGIALFLLTALAGCAHTTAYEPADPLEAVNRKVFAFNMTVDRYALRPIAKGYATVVPRPVRRGVENFFDNLFYPTTIINDMLQGKFGQSGRDLGRFALNTTAGIVGVFDVASRFGLTKNNEDLGQTLGVWGVGEGWFVMLPLLGPSSNRDLVGRVGDHWSELPTYDDNISFLEGLAIIGADAVDARSRLLDSDSMLQQQLDPYLFIRTAYLQRRYSLLYDGNPPPETFEDFDEKDGK